MEDGVVEIFTLSCKRTKVCTALCFERCNAEWERVCIVEDVEQVFDVLLGHGLVEGDADASTFECAQVDLLL